MHYAVEILPIQLTGGPSYLRLFKNYSIPRRQRMRTRVSIRHNIWKFSPSPQAQISGSSNVSELTYTGQTIDSTPCAS